jgi:hypothetical protein
LTLGTKNGIRRRAGVAGGGSALLFCRPEPSIPGVAEDDAPARRFASALGVVGHGASPSSDNAVALDLVPEREPLAFVESRYAGEGLLRHPAFKGVRRDLLD